MTATGLAFFCDIDANESLCRFADRHGVPLRRDDDPASSEMQLILCADLDDTCLARGTQPPFRGCVEASETAGDMTELALDHVRRGGLAVTLRTRTAYGCEPALHVCAGLAGHLGLEAGCDEAIGLALQEAVANAVMHGNLELDGSLRETVQGFDAFCREIDGKLADPRFGDRHLAILVAWDAAAVELTVVDQGPGYDSSAEIRAGKVGRGLMLISDLTESMAVSDGGRRIAMRFSR